MELSELTAYAKEKYQIEEQHKFPDYPGCSVLCHPKTGKWVALLMRQWNTETGSLDERCDLKCGRQSLAELKKNYLAAPLRMVGAKWISVTFGRETQPEVVFMLFDRAVASGTMETQGGYTIVLDPQRVSGSSGNDENAAYTDTPLPFSGRGVQHPLHSGHSGASGRPAKPAFGQLTLDLTEDTPAEDPSHAAPSPGHPLPKDALASRDPIRDLYHLYRYGSQTKSEKAENFFRQAKFMENYEDNMPWHWVFSSALPAYQDMTAMQLRGYFSWRSFIRKGIFRPIASAAAYIYIYELLNGVGASSPEDSLDKLRAFEAGFLGAGFGDDRMRTQLRNWMMEFCVIHQLPPECARRYADPKSAELDAALAALCNPREHTDEEVFAALCCFGGKKLPQSPVLTADAKRGAHLFAEAWRYSDSLGQEAESAEISSEVSAGVSAAEKEDRHGLFARCFGKKIRRQWYPLSNTLFFRQEKPADQEYRLNECRVYRCEDGKWTVETYEKLLFDKIWLAAFVHEADRMLRKYLKTGRCLKTQPIGCRLSPFIEMAIREDKRRTDEAARPKISIDLSGLDQIRHDSLITRDSLLVEEKENSSSEGMERTASDGEEHENLTVPDLSDLLPDNHIANLPLDPVQTRIVLELLQGAPVGGIIAESRLMPSIVADAINEALFDEIGDVVVLCENDELSLVEDYAEDLKRLFGMSDP